MKPVPAASLSPENIAQFRANLLAWYQGAARPMPWRETTDPYRIWLAEIMLQQTTVAAVIPYYLRFLDKFPTVTALAAADIQEILHLWQGLGYYRRAHQLHACAQVVTQQYGGIFPADLQKLLGLPGIGPYTANAIAATAFNLPASVVDGNVERVVSRLYRIATPLPQGKKEIVPLADALADPHNSRLYANAIMELGATICTPTSPACLICPVNMFCEAFKRQDQTAYPKKSPKKKTPEYSGNVYLITDPSGHLYLRQRPGTGLLSSLWEYPHTGWEKTSPELPPHLATLAYADTGTAITHTFTHFKLTLNIHTATSPTAHPQGHGYAPGSLPPMPTHMQKVSAPAPAKPRRSRAT
jgi:A/G-specific adenine glycosylase